METKIRMIESKYANVYDLLLSTGEPMLIQEIEKELGVTRSTVNAQLRKQCNRVERVETSIIDKRKNRTRIKIEYRAKA